MAIFDSGATDILVHYKFFELFITRVEKTLGFPLHFNKMITVAVAKKPCSYVIEMLKDNDFTIVLSSGTKY